MPMAGTGGRPLGMARWWITPPASPQTQTAEREFRSQTGRRAPRVHGGAREKGAGLSLAPAVPTVQPQRCCGVALLLPPGGARLGRLLPHIPRLSQKHLNTLRKRWSSQRTATSLPMSPPLPPPVISWAPMAASVPWACHVFSDKAQS